MKHQKNGETAPAVSHEASLTAQRQEETREKVSSSVTAQSTSEREVHGRMFISYSRKQFYFAESLVHELRKRDVSVWFDVLGLMPGTSWQQRLREELDKCQGLVLVASRAAMNSTYVRAEWQAALASNKPIYVILFEAVRLPLELQKASILDFRNDFDAKVALLASLIDKGIVHRDRLPRVHLRPHLPPGPLAVMGALWSQVLAFAMFTVLLIQSITHISLARPAALPAAMMFGITWLVLAGYACYFALGFTYRRRIGYTALSIWLLAFPLFIIPVLFVPLYEGHLKTFAAPFGISLVLVPANARSGGFPLAQDLFIFFFIICSCILSLQAFSFIATLTSKNVLRWLATGIAPRELRNPGGSQVWSQVYRRGKSSDGAVKTYRLHYVPRDEQLASEVRDVLGNSYHLRPSSAEQADIHMAVLTNSVPQAWLDQLVHSHPNLICIVATSIRLPPDERIVRQLQWVDYRSGSSVPLERLAFLLGKDEVVVDAFLFPVVPESLEQLVMPWHVKVMSHMLMILAMFNLGVGGATAITLIRQGIGHTPLGTWPVVSVLIAGVLFCLADRLMNRSITYYTILTTVIVVLVSMPLLGTLQALFQMFQGFGLLEIIGIFLGVGLLMSPLLLLWGVHQNLRRWLPKEGRWQSARQRSPTLALPAWKQLWRNKVPYVLASLGLQALLLTHLSLVLPKPPVVLPPGSMPANDKEFPVLSQPDRLVAITKGPDGNLWFTEENFFSDNKIGRITPSGTITEFPLPTHYSDLVSITAGPDGNLWFTENFFSGDKIGRITPSGTITEFPLPTPQSGLASITAGPDGNLWFTESVRDMIGRITPSGTITEFPLPTPQSGLASITVGPDGNLWFTESDNIGRITPSGTITEFPLPTLQSGSGSITAGPDGNLWFTKSVRDIIGRISPAGDIAEFRLPNDLGDITTGPDGNLWFTEMDGNTIGRISPAGIITEFSLSNKSSLPDAKRDLVSITAGPDGNLWFAASPGPGTNVPGLAAGATVGWIQP
jgi:streptogramin lyase